MLKFRSFCDVVAKNFLLFNNVVNFLQSHIVVRVHFKNGKPIEISDFVTGFLNNKDSTQFARVCGLVQDNDGSLLMADDANGIIYRIFYNRERSAAVVAENK